MDNSAWADAMAHIGAAGDRLVTAMRERAVEGDRDVDADVYVTLLGALMDTHLNRISSEAEHPTFVPCCGYYQHLGSPNPDTVYRRAPVDDAASYRLTGERGTAWQVTIMPFTEMMRGFTPFDLSDVAREPDGHFDVLVSPERPAGYDGDWWPLEPGTASLWLRSVSDQWGVERDPRIAITRVDSPRRARPTGDTTRKQLAALGIMVERIVEYGMRHVDELVDEGFVNHLKTVDYGASGAMPLQHYHEGVFRLADDDALVVEARLPAGADYYSWSLTDRMLVTLDWTHAQTSLNKSQGIVDADGVLRVVVCATDPGVANWMDTTGYRSGVVQCREIGSVEVPEVTARVVPIASLRDHLPPDTVSVTPEERARALLTRRTGFQLRSLW
ncbi:MAG TPA: DUF1214 domain-containing protein [Acidimicrobiia bacterium]|nr:DUF1214 domain-containing protein [Acidimicrobiia bacterium]